MSPASQPSKAIGDPDREGLEHAVRRPSVRREPHLIAEQPRVAVEVPDHDGLERYRRPYGLKDYGVAVSEAGYCRHNVSKSAPLPFPASGLSRAHAGAFRIRTPGCSPLVNSTPRASSAR
jgi:hypothetical protein